MASSTFALDFLRRLLCAHSAGAGAGNVPAAAQCGDAAADCAAQHRPAPPGGGAGARSPCVVARLMGLDAMPPPTPDSQPLRRSRSTSSAEGWPPRTGIRASPPSLGAKPAYLREENDEFLILSFSPEAPRGNGELLLPASGSDGEKGDDTKKRSRRRRKLRYGGDEVPRSSGHGRRTAAECGLQNSSPVSVLDAQPSSSTSSSTSISTTWGEVEPGSGSPTSEEIRHGWMQQGSRRKMQSDFDDDLQNLVPPATTTTCHVSKCSDMERRNTSVVDKAEVFTFTPVVSATLQLICRLVEEDLNSMRWLARDSEDIAADTVSDILDELMCQTTDELIHAGKL